MLVLPGMEVTEGSGRVAEAGGHARTGRLQALVGMEEEVEYS